MFVRFFEALKIMQKLTNEVTYSWSRFKQILSAIITKLMRDMKKN